jgi:hypothetical protein
MKAGKSAIRGRGEALTATVVRLFSITCAAMSGYCIDAGPAGVSDHAKLILDQLHS